MMQAFKNFNIADWVSVSRLVLIPVLLYLIFRENKNWIGWIMLAGFFTDALDGYLARHLQIATPKGTRLDTLADFLFLLCCLFGFFWIFWDFVQVRPWLPLGAIGLFALQLVLALIRYGKASSFHTYLAKITAVVMAILLVTSFLYRPLPWLYTLAFGLALLEAVEEIVLVLVLSTPKSNVKGLFWVLQSKA